MAGQKVPDAELEMHRTLLAPALQKNRQRIDRGSAEEANAPNVVDLAEARERLDGGRRTALAELLDPTKPESRFDLASDAVDSEEEFNREIAAAVMTELSEIRCGYIHAMKYLDSLGDRLAHVAIGERVNSLDDLRDVLKERWGL
jgi:hypothetical protein